MPPVLMPVGDSSPGMSPSRLQKTMKIANVPIKPRYFGPSWPMLLSSCSLRNSTNNSNACCRCPGLSTERRERIMLKRMMMNSTTMVSITTCVGMTSSLGATCKRRSEATGPPKTSFTHLTIIGASSIPKILDYDANDSRKTLDENRYYVYKQPCKDENQLQCRTANRNIQKHTNQRVAADETQRNSSSAASLSALPDNEINS